jgi:hypothetical protein
MPWPERVRVGVGEALRMLAANPALGHLIAIEALQAGSAARQLQQASLARLAEISGSAGRSAPGSPPTSSTCWPRGASFYGIVITMYYEEHGVPHVHAHYAECEASISIGTLKILGGWLPGRALALVLQWARLHRDELRTNWERAHRDPLKAIAPVALASGHG